MPLYALIAKRKKGREEKLVTGDGANGFPWAAGDVTRSEIPAKPRVSPQRELYLRSIFYIARSDTVLSKCLNWLYGLR